MNNTNNIFTSATYKSGIILPEKSSIALLREQFLSDPKNTDLSSLRPVIARSWRRSVMCSVNPFDNSNNHVCEPQLDGQFLRLAEPVIKELENLCIDTNGCVSLSDHLGVLATFRGSPSAIKLADNAFPINGGCMSEELVGTNSEGTAIEEGRAVQVWGSEHFNESFQDLCCTSVPIRDPFRRSIRGVLSLSLPTSVVKDVDPRSILLIVQGAAAEITNSLISHLASEEQALLYEYIRESRKRGADLVVAMNDKTTIANRLATEILDQNDFSILSAYSKDFRSRDNLSKNPTFQSKNQSLRIHIRPIEETNINSGSIIRLSKMDKKTYQNELKNTNNDEEKKSKLIGENLHFKRSIDKSNIAISHNLPVYIVGESGTGKKSFAKEISLAMSKKSSIYDLKNNLDENIYQKIINDIENDSHITLLHLDKLPPKEIDKLCEIFNLSEYKKICITMENLNDKTLKLISSLKGIEIKIPPLRSRREDIPLLANHFIKQNSNKSISKRLMNFLTSSDWSGNISQLKEVIEYSSMNSNLSEIRIDDLSEIHKQELTSSRLSRLQRAELDQIKLALLEANGNRVKAAELLRIGRSTLYRKIDSYTSRGFHIEFD